ncbi:MAG: hypothetical protein ABUL69_04415, partial [Peristeroidobacter soli]
VFMEGFSFRVDKETGRASVEVDYTYWDRAAFGLDGGIGPEPTVAQIPGLSYDAEGRAVVYDAAGKRVICATVRKHKFLFWSGLSVTPTGACIVNSRRTSHVEDTGWIIHRFEAIDTFFVVK